MLKEKILKLKKEGLSQSEIALQLGCAKSTVCWHFNPEKQLKKSQQRKKKIAPHMVKWQRNISRFSTAKTKIEQKTEIKDLTFSEARAKFRNRLKDYAKKHKSDTERTKMVNIKKVIDKYNITEENTKIVCRYTGDILDWKRPEECQVDHIIPRSRGGENTLENLQIISKKANQAKGDMTHEEFIEFIKLVNSNLAL
jgi:5-methylcytosine-specific restriction endonuclease McrA